MPGTEKHFLITVSDSSSLVGIVFGAARRRLLDHDVQANRISTKIIKALRVGHASVRRRKIVKYAVVVFGLVGRRNEGVTDWFMGTKSNELAKKIEKAVLWCC